MDSKNILIAILLAVILAMSLFTCNSNSGGLLDPVIISETKDSSLVGTQTIEYIHDTIRDTTEVFTHENVKPIADSIKPETFDTNAFLRTFYYPIKDSHMDGTIVVKSEVRPAKLNFDYKLFIKTFKDSTIITNDTTKTINTIQKVRVNQLYLGGATELSPFAGSAGITLDIVSKKGLMYGAEFGYDINSQHKYIKVKLAKVISFRNKHKK